MNNLLVDSNFNNVTLNNVRLSVYVLSDNASSAYYSFIGYLTNTRSGATYRKYYYAHYDLLSPTEWNFMDEGTAEVRLTTT